MPEAIAHHQPHDALQENRRQISRFLVIGGASVAVDLVTYMALTGPLALDTHLAKGIAYVSGMVVGFVGNKFWTFGSARRSVAEPISYALLYATTLAVNIGVNGAVLAVGGSAAKLPAFLVATGTTTVLNFLGMRWVTFRGGIDERLQAEHRAERQPHAGPTVSPGTNRIAIDSHHNVTG